MTPTTRGVTALLVALVLAAGLGFDARPAQAAPSSHTVAARQSHTAARQSLPLVYVASAVETKQLAESFATPMRLRGYDVHVFLTKDDADPANNPYVTIRGNSAKLGRYVAARSKRTGRQRVDVVGASQTGLVIRYWLKYYGGAQHTRTAVLLSGLIKGSPYQAQWLRQGRCPPADRVGYLPPRYRKLNPTPACEEEAMGSKVVTALNTPREALPGVRYVNVTTLQEEEAAPYWINLMSGPGNYRNVVTQNLCPNDPVVHMTLTLTPSMQSLVDSALRGGPLRMDCMVPVVPGLPTLRDTVTPLKSPPGVALPPGYRVPPGY